MRPGRDARDGNLDEREMRALANENSGTETRRREVVARRAQAAATVSGTQRRAGK
jgi:hypothetical protein